MPVAANHTIAVPTKADADRHIDAPFEIPTIGRQEIAIPAVGRLNRPQPSNLSTLPMGQKPLSATLMETRPVAITPKMNS